MGEAKRRKLVRAIGAEAFGGTGTGVYTAAAREEAETVADLFHLLQWLKGDPRLSADEEKFLSEMVRQLWAGHSPSRYQWGVIHSLTPLTETDPEVVNWP